MEKPRDRAVTIAVVTGVIMLLLGLCLGALAGGVGGFLVGRQNAARVIERQPERIAPESFNTPLPESAAQGVVVQEVVAGSPAAAAGIRPGDVVIAINGAPLDANHQLRDMLSQFKPGDRIELTLERNGERQAVGVELGARPDNRNAAYLGIRY